MRQSMRGVRLELHAFLEVHQVQFDFLGTVVQSEIRDEGVQERRFARARFAGNEDMMGGALAKLQMLPFGSAGSAEGDVDAEATVGHPPLVRWRSDKFKRNLHSSRFAGFLPGHLQ